MLRKCVLASLVSVFCGLSLSPVLATAAAPYRLVDLSMSFSPGYNSYAYAINDLGQVVGESNWDPVLWHADHTPQMIGIPSAIEVNDINNAGQVALSVYYVSGTRGVIWQNGSETVLGTLGGKFSRARAVNDRGQVVGLASNVGSYDHAFFWDPVTGMRDLGTFGGTSSQALGINEAGQVVGFADTPGFGPEYAFVWDSARGMTQLSSLPGAVYTRARAINEAGQIAGVSGSRAALWDSTGTITDLGAFPGGLWSDAVDINNHGQVIGTAEYNQYGEERPFLWDSAHGMRYLTDYNEHRFYYDCVATGINDRGQIVGYGVYAFTPYPYGDPIYHALLWDPIPEPTSLCSLLCGLGTLAALVNRKPKLSRKT